MQVYCSTAVSTHSRLTKDLKPPYAGIKSDLNRVRVETCANKCNHLDDLGVADGSAIPVEHHPASAPKIPGDAGEFTGRQVSMAEARHVVTYRTFRIKQEGHPSVASLAMYGNYWGAETKPPPLTAINS